MKLIATYAAALSLAVLLVGCAEETLVENSSPEHVGQRVQYSMDQVHPHAILGGAAHSNTLGRAASADAHAEKANGQTELTGPLFGLATAPNDDILVADASSGVILINSKTHAPDMPLPGVTDVAPIGHGSVWAMEGLTGGEPGEDTGQALYRISRGGARLIVDLFAFEATHNPDGHAVPDSNPFDVEAIDGAAALVADAGGNDLLRVDNDGNVEVIAVFPDELVSTANLKDLIGCPNPSELCGLPPQIPAQPVPTSIAVGPDGYYYVGELKGFPAPTGASNVWKISPEASGAMCGSSPDCVKLFDGGFTSIIDLAFDPHGRLYVAELDEQSWFAVEALGGRTGGSINSCDIGALDCEEVATGIPILTAIAFERDGTLWATQNALIPGLASVVEIP